MLIGTLGHTQEKAAVKKTITAAELAAMDVIGDLGVPLGEVVEVQAVIVSGSETRAKVLQGRYLLRIESVNGTTLDKPATKTFIIWPHSHVKIANDHWSLYELKTGRKTESSDSEQIKELEKGYVGKRVKLSVYESGSFEGTPHRMPKDVITGADFRFTFSTYLIVLKDRG
ncbi:MAG: hypothetical protein H7062_14160 [Candidatus Saccharimonas sp.]|nr:hypothetical protein [Planctomycetaceae bacterium]